MRICGNCSKQVKKYGEPVLHGAFLDQIVVCSCGWVGVETEIVDVDSEPKPKQLKLFEANQDGQMNWSLLCLLPLYCLCSAWFLIGLCVAGAMADRWMEVDATMNTGMMWFDNDPKTSLDVKIQKAAEYYRQKYGRIPDMCLVNPGMLDNTKPEVDSRQAGKITVRPLRSVLPGHLWIGVDDDKRAGV